MLGADLAASLPELQAQAESLLIDRCIIERPSGWTVDPVTAEQSPTWAMVASGVPCRLRPGSALPLGMAVAGQEAAGTRPTLAVPLSTDVHVGDRCTVTASRDASLVGVALFVDGVPRGPHLALRRLTVTEDQSG